MTAGGAGRQLSKAGFKQVYVLNGGMASGVQRICR